MVARLLRDRKVDITSAIQFMDDAVARVSAKGLERHLVLDLHFIRAMLLAESEWIAQTITELDSGALTWTTPPIEASLLVAQHPEPLEQR